MEQACCVPLVRNSSQALRNNGDADCERALDAVNRRMSNARCCPIPKGFVSESYALNILICNDDGYTAGNVRALYSNLKTAGHNIIVSAPVDNQSGRGGFACFMTPILKIPASYIDMYTLSNTPVVPRAVKASVYPSLIGQSGVGDDPNDADISVQRHRHCLCCWREDLTSASTIPARRCCHAP